jgi:carbohydrate diacid regulator
MWQGQQLASPYDKLIARDPSGQLRKTLHTLFDHQGQMKACANALFIHRNTLRYRLDKIEQITQISPHQFSGLVTLYLAAQLADIQ